jgi:rubrerythrin
MNLQELNAFKMCRQCGKTNITTQIMKNKLKSMHQINGKFAPIELEDVVMLRCSRRSCGQIHFGREVNSICPDCKIGTLEVENDGNNN